MSEKINYGYLIGMAFVGAVGFLQIGYCFVYFSVFMLITHKQYVHAGKYVIASEDLFNSINGGIIPFGAIFGSLIVSPFLKYGRRNALIVLAIIMISATSLTLVFNFFALIIGRFCIGLCIGAYATLSPLFVAEISPPEISSTIGVMNQLMAVTGVFVSNTIAFVLPYSVQEGALTSTMWRLVFIGPAVIALVQLLLILFVFKYDTPKFYQLQGRTAEYNAVMKCIYAQHSLDFCEENLVSQDKNKSIEQVQTKPQSSGFGDSKALMVGIVLSAIHQFTGINGVAFNSNKLFVEGVSGLEAEKAARIGSFFIGVAGLAGTGFSVYLSKHFSKKTLMLFGECEMMINHFFLCIDYYNNFGYYIHIDFDMRNTCVSPGKQLFGGKTQAEA